MVTFSASQYFSYSNRKACRATKKDTFTPRKVLVIPRKRWLHPDMTEKLLTGTLSINTNKKEPQRSQAKVSDEKYG